METGTIVISLGSDYDPARASALKAALARTDGVDSVEFNYTNNKLTLRFDPRRVSLAKLEAMVMRERKSRSPSEV